MRSGGFHYGGLTRCVPRILPGDFCPGLQYALILGSAAHKLVSTPKNEGQSACTKPPGSELQWLGCRHIYLPAASSQEPGSSRGEAES